VARIVTDPPGGTLAGAVYVPDGEMVPTVPFPPSTPFTDHTTPCPAPVTVAERPAVAPTGREAGAPTIATPTAGGGVIAIVASSNASGAATLVARIVTDPPGGTESGAT
jgi:hypothetical protein